ncbi:MAG TPA: CocE/NonD family hydrolase [Euzebyales bacterium]|nr:CocE/NonD family hydrolase [Euzebyales bacterium]
MTLGDRLADRLLGLPPATTGDVAVERDLPVPMRDGVTLRADRHVPAGDDRAPLLLVRTPYGRRGSVGRLPGWGRAAARRGLQAVIVSTRGTGGSEGDLDPMLERDDGVDTVAWLRAQPWYPGRFATAGPGYLGLTQWAIADAAPGELVAMVPMVSAAQFGHLHHPGGVTALQAPLDWTIRMARAGRRGPAPLRGPLRASRLRAALRSLPVERMDVAASGRDTGWWRAWVTNTDPDGDAYWQRRDHRPQVGATTAEVLLIAAWDDILLPWQLDDHAALVAAGRSPRLVVGPWDHGRGSAQVGAALTFVHGVLTGDGADAPGGGDVSARGRRDAGGGAPHPGDGAGPVRLYVTGADQWRDLAAWPVPEAQPTPLYLRAGGALGLPPEDDDAAATVFRYDPTDPTPNVGGPVWGETARRRQDGLIARDDVVAFAGRILDEPVEIIGPVTATIHLRSTIDHAQLFVRLCDVDAQGRTWHVCDGIQRVDDGRWPRGADRVRCVRVRLWPTAHRFLPGHRIRVLIAGGAHPRFVRAFGTGEPVATATRGRRATHEVLHDAGHPSSIELPIMPLR